MYSYIDCSHYTATTRFSRFTGTPPPGPGMPPGVFPMAVLRRMTSWPLGPHLRDISRHVKMGDNSTVGQSCQIPTACRTMFPTVYLSLIGCE